MIELILIGFMQVTSYRSVPEQTDSTPFTTSIQTRVMDGGIAVSQDQLCPGSLFKATKIKRHSSKTCHLRDTKLHYGDVVFVYGYGMYRINDCMHKRHKKCFDIWVKTYKQEKKFGVRRIYVYKIPGA